MTALIPKSQQALGRVRGEFHDCVQWLEMFVDLLADPGYGKRSQHTRSAPTGLEPVKDGLDGQRRVHAAEVQLGVRDRRRAVVEGLDDQTEAWWAERNKKERPQKQR